MKRLRRLWWAWRDRKLPYPLRRVTVEQFEAMVKTSAYLDGYRDGYRGA